MKTLTKKQQKVFDYISRRLSIGDNPTQRQIAGYFKISQNAVFQIVRYLKIKGYLKSEKGRRGLKLSSASWQNGTGDKIPVIGSAITGSEGVDNSPVKRFINISSILSKAGDMFFVRASGNALAPAGIVDGDYVLVKPGSGISESQIALVLIGDKMWLKNVVVKSGEIFCEPLVDAKARKTQKKKVSHEIKIASSDIVGRVVGLIRLPME
jgi:SOS-response transcriptional repressor LexA